MNEAEDWAVIVRAKNQEIQKWQQQALELSNLVAPLRDEVARLTRRAGDLEGRFKMVGKYMGNGRMQQAHDLVKDTIVAIYMTEPKQAALTPQAGKGGDGE